MFTGMCAVVTSLLASIKKLQLHTLRSRAFPPLHPLHFFSSSPSLRLHLILFISPILSVVAQLAVVLVVGLVSFVFGRESRLDVMSRFEWMYGSLHNFVGSRCQHLLL